MVNNAKDIKRTKKLIREEQKDINVEEKDVILLKDIENSESVFKDHLIHINKQFSWFEAAINSTLKYSLYGSQFKRQDLNISEQLSSFLREGKFKEAHYLIKTLETDNLKEYQTAEFQVDKLSRVIIKADELQREALGEAARLKKWVNFIRELEKHIKHELNLLKKESSQEKKIDADLSV